jgi:hypothetical protein
MVATIKVDGEVLREDGDIVYLPFGSEYSIYLKNLHNTGAVVSIKIDGRDIFDGDTLYVRAKGSIDLKRFLEGNMSDGHRFKFIEKTEKISEHRGDKPEDGLVVIEYQFEIPKPKSTYNPVVDSCWYSSSDASRITKNYDTFTTGSILRGDLNPQVKMVSADTLGGQSQPLKAEMNFSSEVFAQPCSNLVTTSGITVNGERCNQSFSTINVRPLESAKYTMVFQLKGKTPSSKVVEEPVLVSTKLTCATCGTVNDSTHKFCKECGTCLI